MSLPASTLRSNSAPAAIPRRSANFHPSIWGDCFLQYASQSMEADDAMKEQITGLEEKVSKMLLPATDKPLLKLNLIDSIQRLGVCYHFEREIDQVLQEIHKNFVYDGKITLDEDIHFLSLFFRLLRQQGYRISPDVFHKFKDVDGSFSERLTMDVEGMLSLYEAAHLRIHGEEILDEALAFTSTHLERMKHQLSPSLVSKVNHSLRYPLRKSLPRLEALRYISTYQEDPGHDETLLALAKLDFNMVQKLHQKELADVSL
ncbi:hypothetical protein L6164_018554 [Bauhinia variegata]|uniref:Uncharacterized protein n=1 Tax=Bauhinia variegata TaxID=167791 RepID=A0ACB9NBE1_BAUVA|nr:hypothetical protein L6164_018554 [Bauhinia variegata]